MNFSVDDLWQVHFHSEFVIYTQKFDLQNFRIKVFLYKLINLWFSTKFNTSCNKFISILYFFIIFSKLFKFEK